MSFREDVLTLSQTDSHDDQLVFVDTLQPPVLSMYEISPRVLCHLVVLKLMFLLMIQFMKNLYRFFQLNLENHPELLINHYG